MAIKKLKSGKYQADWYDECGARKRKSFPNKSQAEYYILQQKIFDSTEGKARQAMNFKQMTVAELTDRYVNEHFINTRTINNSSYFNLIKKRWGTYKLFRIASPEVRQWFLCYINGTAQDKKFALATTKKLLAYFKRIFTWGIEMEIITQNPIDGLSFKKEFKRVNRRNVVLEPDQFWDLISKLPKEPEYLQPVCIAAWCTGMRIGEIFNLKWRNVDTVNWLIRLKADETKESDIKTIGIESELKEILELIKTQKACNEDDYVFTSSKGVKSDYRSLGRAFRIYADKAGYKNIRFHDFRHCFTRRKRREGFDRSVIKAQTGHHTDSMFDWYDKVDEQEIQNMSGTTNQNQDLISKELLALVKKAKENEVSLGTLQSLIGRVWRAKAA